MIGFVSLTQVARQLIDDVDVLADRVVDLVWERVPGYQPPRMQRSELADAVAPNLRSVLGLLCAEGDDGLDERARAIGVSRALQGVPLDAVVLSYRSAERVLADAFVGGMGELTRDELRDGLRTLADGFDRLATASIESYRETQREVTTHYDRVAGDLVAGLAGGELDAQQVRRLAQMLGGDPDDTWQAVAISVRDDPELAVSVRLLRDVLAALGRGRAGRILAGSARGCDVLLVPGSIGAADLGALERAVAGHAAAASLWVTVGEQVPGLPEAEASCRQALMAMEVAARSRPGGSVVPYGDVLLDVMATADSDAAGALARRYAAPIREFPHLVETVLALASADLSIRGAAASLYVHPNTVIYRLGRVRELTGHDPRRLPELMAFLMALRAD